MAPAPASKPMLVTLGVAALVAVTWTSFGAAVQPSASAMGQPWSLEPEDAPACDPALDAHVWNAPSGSRLEVGECIEVTGVVHNNSTKSGRPGNQDGDANINLVLDPGQEHLLTGGFSVLHLEVVCYDRPWPALGGPEQIIADSSKYLTVPLQVAAYGNVACLRSASEAEPTTCPISSPEDTCLEYRSRQDLPSCGDRISAVGRYARDMEHASSRGGKPELHPVTSWNVTGQAPCPTFKL